MLVSPDAKLGPYRLRGIIASGGMGVVHRAEHVETGQPAAVKTIRALGEHTLESIRREVHGLSRISHPGVVKLLEYGTDDGLPWYAMELLAGVTLAERLDRLWQRTPLVSPYGDTFLDGGEPIRPADTRTGGDGETGSGAGTGGDGGGAAADPGPRREAACGALREILTIARGLCQTLEYLHGEGVVHRDLKPENVVLREPTLPVIVDFGVFHRFAGAGGREALELDRAVLGTVEYMAPEQIRGAPVDARTDLYALGCILFAAVCGRAPFLARPDAPLSEQHLQAPPPVPSSLVDGVPPALDRLILHLLAKDPADRPGHADDAGAVLDALGAAPSPALAEPRARPYLYRPPFTGHAELLHTLRAELSKARQWRGRSALLVGPSGAGKTRLAIELAQEARRARMVPVSGECAPVGAFAAEGDALARAARSEPLAAFRPLLRAVSDRCRVEGEATTARLLGAHVRVLEPYEPSLAGVPGADAYPVPPPLAPRDAGERVARAVVDVLAAYTVLAPVLLVVDDAQWADDLTLGALSILARSPPSPFGALVLVTARSEDRRPEIEAMRASPHVLSLHLDPLDVGDLDRIAAGMTALSSVPPALSKLFAAECGGSPFFVAEYLKLAVSSGLLVRREGRWELDAAPRGDGAPHELDDGDSFAALRSLGSVRTLLARRLDGLGPAARALALAGAVRGREWSERDTAAIAGLDAKAALDALEELLGGQIVVEADGDLLRFVHDRIREAAYDAIAPDERRRLHARTAAALEAPAMSPDAATCRALAFHHAQAGATERAFFYAERAGREALASGSFREAGELLAQAIALAEASGGPIAPSPDERARLYRLHADALYAAGDVERAGARTAEAIAALGLLRLPVSDGAWARRALPLLSTQASLRILPVAPLRGEERQRFADTAYLLARLSEMFIYQDRPIAFLGANLAASNYAERAGAAATLAWVHVNLSVALCLLRMEGLGRRYVESSRRAAARTDDLDAALYQGQVESFFWHLVPDWEAATRTADAALARARAAGAAFRAEQILVNGIVVRLAMGDFGRAAEDAAALSASARTYGHDLNHAFGQMLLGFARVGAGELDPGIRLLEAVEGFFDKPNLTVHRANCRATLAGARLARGDLAGALGDAQRVCELLPAPDPANILTSQIQRYLPKVLLAARHPRAEAATRAASRFAFHVPYARPFALRHRADEALQQGRQLRARHLLEESLAAARALRMPVEEAWTLQSLARLAERGSPGSA